MAFAGAPTWRYRHRPAGAGRLRGGPPHPRAPRPATRCSLIAMTGYGQPEDRRRALQAGFDRYLVKPVDPAVLSQLLNESRHRNGRQAPRQAARG